MGMGLWELLLLARWPIVCLWGGIPVGFFWESLELIPPNHRTNHLLVYGMN